MSDIRVEPVTHISCSQTIAHHCTLSSFKFLIRDQLPKYFTSVSSQGHSFYTQRFQKLLTTNSYAKHRRNRFAVIITIVKSNTQNTHRMSAQNADLIRFPTSHRQIPWTKASSRDWSVCLSLFGGSTHAIMLCKLALIGEAAFAANHMLDR